jgi:predicted ATPase
MSASNERALPVSRIQASNFRSLRSVDVELGPLTVLVGPNGSGKSNLLKVLQFISAATSLDIDAALSQWGGFEHVQRRARETGAVVLSIEGSVTEYASSTALDSYRLRLNQTKRGISRTEDLVFKRKAGPGRRITVSGTEVTIRDDQVQDGKRRLADEQTSGLGTLARLADDEIGPGPRSYAKFLSSLRVLEPDVEAARRPSRLVPASLSDDASNLAAALFQLSRESPDGFVQLQRDLGRCLPGLARVELSPVGGSSSSVVVQLIENGVTSPIELADASFGTVRLLALLTALHEPNPPAFTAIEEIDHGLHPYALDVLLDRMREATSRTQILAATHSPTLVNRLDPTEIVVCDRDSESGESVIPSRTPEEIADAMEVSNYGPGELWFAGIIGGIPE